MRAAFACSARPCSQVGGPLLVKAMISATVAEHA